MCPPQGVGERPQWGRPSRLSPVADPRWVGPLRVGRLGSPLAGRPRPPSRAAPAVLGPGRASGGVELACGAESASRRLVHRPDRERPRWVRDPDGGGGGHGGAEVRRVQPAAGNGGERLETIGYPERRVDPCIQAVSSRRFFSACVDLTSVWCRAHAREVTLGRAVNEFIRERQSAPRVTGPRRPSGRSSQAGTGVCAGTQPLRRPQPLDPPSHLLATRA